MKAVFDQLKVTTEEHAGRLGLMGGAKSLPFKILIGASLFGHALSLISSSFFSLFTLSPSSLFAMQLWRLVTAPFVGHNLFVLTWTIASLHFGTRLLMQEHSNLHLLKTLVITQIGTSVFLCILSYFLYALFGSSYLLYDVSICGMAPICATVLVLVKQFLPDSIVIATPFGRIKYTHLPLNGCIISLISSLIGLIRFVVALEIIIGTQISWSYLRFIVPHETDAVAGDPSDHFAWATMFPSAFRPFCTLVSKATFRTLVRIGVCKRRQIRHVDVSNLLSITSSPSSPVMNTRPQPLSDEQKDAERRRQKALLALNERLKKSAIPKNDDTIDWDEDTNSVDDDDGAPKEVITESVQPVNVQHEDLLPSNPSIA